jgi:murein DD-endopeptidase MepM/ murein hydrolase activator NlpD
MAETSKGVALAFFLTLLLAPVCEAQDAETARDFPVITRLDSRDAGFRQYISDVENNRKLLVGHRSRPGEAAQNLTIYQYTPGLDDDIFSLSARCNVPYSSLASLNRLASPIALETGKPLLLPSCPGIFIPVDVETDMEMLLGAARSANKEAAAITVNMAGRNESFHFFPGADFSPTERGFFLNPGFRFPLRSYRLTSAFGFRLNPVTGSNAMHQGIDMAAPEGASVFAAADGLVIETGENPVYGKYIIIRHGERWTSLYGHLQKVETALRMEVKSGSLIGRVGSTGQSTGPHLHFELRQDGKALDPAGRLRP